MSVPAAYLGIILIWSTTPLAVKWSGEGAGFLFGVTARMVIGAVICFALLWMLRVPFSWRPDARRAYMAAATGVFGAMMLTYWGAQYIPSGLISVLYGITPFATGIMATVLLGERSLSVVRVAAIGLGITGLAVIFRSGLHLSPGSGAGILAVLGAALLHSASAVLVKRTGADVHPLALNAGALAIAVPLYLFTWGLLDGHFPSHLGERAWAAIVYLGVFGTALGFVLYFYVLKHLSAGVIALITLVTPVVALVVGHAFNGETVEGMVWAGTAFILGGLLLYQFGGARNG